MNNSYSKKIFLTTFIITLVILSSTQTTAFSFMDFFQDVKNFFTGRVIDPNELTEEDKTSSDLATLQAEIKKFEEANPLGNYIVIDAYIPAKKDLNPEILQAEIIEAEIFLEKNVCSSNWACSEWEECSSGVSSRTCIDLNQCEIPVNKPLTTKNCEVSTCIDEWECEWSPCENKITSPISCKALNSCKTSFNKPTAQICESEKKECIPEIQCTTWSECSVDYSLTKLTGNTIGDLKGIKSRVCTDFNRCINSQEQLAECSLGADIYPLQLDECLENYIVIYDKLTGNLIARIERGNEDQPFLNIDLSSTSKPVSCNTCFNNVRDGSESGLDCGGDCKPCSSKQEIF